MSSKEKNKQEYKVCKECRKMRLGRLLDKDGVCKICKDGVRPSVE